MIYVLNRINTHPFSGFDAVATLWQASSLHLEKAKINARGNRHNSPKFYISINK